ncbi:MAG: hypothetical protein AB7D36_05910 [Oscillospiraceae bacterium]
MKILTKIIVSIGALCLGLGIISIGVAMLTGAGLTSVMNHGIVPEYINGLLEMITPFVAKAELFFSNLIY